MPLFVEYDITFAEKKTYEKKKIVIMRMALLEQKLVTISESENNTESGIEQDEAETEAEQHEEGTGNESDDSNIFNGNQ